MHDDLIKRAEKAAGMWTEVDYRLSALLRDLATALRTRTLPPEPPPGHVRVRLIVAVGSDGEWTASGDKAERDDEPDFLCNLLAFTGAARTRVSFITADVPLPEPVAEVVGAIEAGEVP